MSHEGNQLGFHESTLRGLELIYEARFASLTGTRARVNPGFGLDLMQKCCFMPQIDSVM